MSKFIVINPWKKIPNNLFPIQSDPSLKYEVYIFSKKRDVMFDEVLDIFYKSINKNDYLGAMSLIYFKYYNEFYKFLIEISENMNLTKKYKKAILKFYKNYLVKWIEFIKYSDDTMYPQNEVFRKMHIIITQNIIKS